MIYTYDSTTGGSKRIDWDLTCMDLSKEEDKEFNRKKLWLNYLIEIKMYSLQLVHIITTESAKNGSYRFYVGFTQEYWNHQSLSYQ